LAKAKRDAAAQPYSDGVRRFARNDDGFHAFRLNARIA
jgi:hypothetical protein